MKHMVSPHPFFCLFTILNCLDMAPTGSKPARCRLLSVARTGVFSPHPRIGEGRRSRHCLFQFRNNFFPGKNRTIPQALEPFRVSGVVPYGPPPDARTF